MKNLWVVVLVLSAAVAVGVTALSQPPDGKQKGKFKAKEGALSGRFQLGRVLPPFAREELNLTQEQELQLDALEKHVKGRLESILTDKQILQLRDIRPPMPPGGPGAPKRGERDGANDRGRPPRPPERSEPGGDQARGNGGAAIQWFATWESGQKEAERTSRPILLVSAAPHCAGVSGIW